LVKQTNKKKGVKSPLDGILNKPEVLEKANLKLFLNFNNL